MKALEIFTSCSFCARDDRERSALGGGAIYVDASAGLQAVLPRRDHLIAGCHAIIDDCDTLADLAHFEGARLHRTVGLDHIGVVAVRPALQRARGYGHYIWRSAREKSDVEILARPQRTVIIRESALNTHCARGLSNLVVEDCYRAFSQL